MALSKSVNLTHAQRAVPCNVCEDEVPGEYYCIECKQTLCSQCEKNHRRVAATRNHNIVVSTQVAEIDTITLTCTDHGDQASFHCEKCNVPVCTKCVTGKHKGHAVSDIDDILEKEKIILQDETNIIQRFLLTAKKQKEEILAEKEDYNRKIKRVTKEMDDENNAFITELQRIHMGRLNDITRIQDSHLAMFDGLASEIEAKIILYEDRISENKDAISKNSLPALRHVAKGKVSLPKIGSKPEFPNPSKYEPGNLHSLSENVGKLDISATSPMSRQLKGTPPTIVSKFKSPLEGSSSICITKEGEVWLGGWESRELVMVDIKGRVLKNWGIQDKSNAMAVMECGDMIISPHSAYFDFISAVGRLVSTPFGADYPDSIIRRQLKNGGSVDLYNTKPTHSYGVSVTVDQKILICTGDNRVLRINGDGTKVEEIYRSSGYTSAFHAVENADGNTYITDRSVPAVVVVSKVGKVLSTITRSTTGQKLGWSSGLAIDQQSNMLCADRNNNCVFIIDQNQQMTELVGRSHGINGPRWLAVDNDNNLWITQYDGNVHVVKYLSP